MSHKETEFASRPKVILYLINSMKISINGGPKNIESGSGWNVNV